MSKNSKSFYFWNEKSSRLQPNVLLCSKIMKNGKQIYDLNMIYIWLLFWNFFCRVIFGLQICFKFVSFGALVSIIYFYILFCYDKWSQILWWLIVDFSGSKFVSLVSLLFHLEPEVSGVIKKVIVTKWNTWKT